MSAAGARGTSPSRYARSRATRVGQAVIPIENGGLRAWGRVSDAGGRPTLRDSFSRCGTDNVGDAGWCSLSTT
jgi:hypothetical protein